MKKIFILTVLVFYFIVGYSQWTQLGGNIYNTPLTDNVGIGLNNPNNLLQVNNLIEFNNTTFGTFVGQNAGINNTAIYNTFFGYEAGKLTTSGKQNVFVGYLAGTVNTTGKNNVFMGESAGASNTIGNSNSFIGRMAGTNNTDGSENTFVGKESGRYNTTGSNNTAIGTQAIRGNTTGNYNMALGNNALQNSTTANSNVAIGYSALGGYDRIYTGNVVIGYEAGNHAENISNCVLIGNNVGDFNTTSNRLMIDNSWTETPLIDGDFSTNTLTVNGSLGLSSGATITEFSIDGAMTGNSDDALCTEKAIVTYVNSTISGSVSWTSGSGVIYPNNLTDSIGIGLNNPNNLLQVSNLIEFNNTTFGTFVGQNAGINNTAIYNTFFGYEAGKLTTSGKQNVFVGYLAGTVNTTGKNDVFLGESAGASNTIGNSNSFIGRMAGTNNTDGSENTFVGKESGRYNTTGSNNTAIGTQAIKGNTTGSYNMVLGNNALQNSTLADSNIVIGWSAMGGYNNIYKNNVVIGFRAANLAGSFSNSLLIGNMVGETTASSNRLMIDMEDTNTPLIDGNFSTNTLTINDVLKLTPRATAPSNPVAGMMYIDSSDVNKLKVYDGTVWHAMW